MRYLCAGTDPGHGFICTFRVQNGELLASAVRHGHAVEQMRLMEDEIATLRARAADSDSAPLRDGLSIPAEIERREDRRETLEATVAVMRERAKERHTQEQAEYLKKFEQRSEKER